MDIEFHYHITYIIARTAGFLPEEASIIATSSQYTDDNNEVYIINEGRPDAYSNYISQTMNIFKPQKELMNIYPVFHFMPGTLAEIAGNSTRRRDGKLHLMNTVPDSSNSRQLLNAALYSHNLYRIGIATHMYADTFSHQNFVGFDDGFNNMKGVRETLIPSIGHADAKHQPDLPALKWEDKRLVSSHSEVDNKKRFLEATRCIYDRYAAYLNSSNDSQDLITAIDEAIGDYGSDKKARVERYQALIGGEYIKYNRKRWFTDAVDLTTEKLPGDENVVNTRTVCAWRGDYLDSHWYKFQEAVKTHQWLAMDTVIGPIFEKMEFKVV